MSIRIVQTQTKVTLFFDRSAKRLSHEQLELLREQIAGVEGVISVVAKMTWFGSQRMTIVLSADTKPSEILRRMASALRIQAGDPSTVSIASQQTISRQASAPAPQAASSVAETRIRWGAAGNSRLDPWTSIRRRIREICYGILAWAAFGMAWVGLLVPGIPTIPFVILTAYFAVNASPKLRTRLANSRVFGPMIRDWQTHHAIRRSVQIKAYVFTIILMTIGFAVTPPIPELYVLMAVMGTIGLWMISRLPVIEASDDNRSHCTEGASSVTPAVA